MKDDSFCRRLLDSQRTSLVVLDRKLRIRYLNAAGEALLYASAQQLLSARLAYYFPESSTVEKGFHGCLGNGLAFTRREVELRDAAGHIQLVDYSVALLDDGGTEFALLVELQPVDRLRRMSREEGWQQAHVATRQLVRGVAHELKNPLGGIKGAAELLADALPSRDWQEYLDVIVNESNRLCELADRLLGVNHAPELRLVNIHECVERVRQLVQAEQPGMTVVRDYDPSLPELLADRNQLVQALLNLVRNAMQSVLENQVEDARIGLRTRALRQFNINGERHRLVLRIDVEDNGPGVPEALQEALFFPLVTGRAQGTGLGLAIAQDIVRQHQGIIDCDSRPGYTCFSVLLPVPSGSTRLGPGSAPTSGSPS